MTAATWMTRKEVAAFLRLSPSTLANWAVMDLGPTYTRLGKGRTLYRQEDVESWLLGQAKEAA
jgi:hypothetical protein